MMNSQRTNNSVFSPRHFRLSAQSAILNPRRLCVRIADIAITLVSEDPGLMLGVDGPMQQFVVDETAPDVHVRATWSDLHNEDGGEKIFDSGGPWQLYAEGGSYRFVCTSPFFGSGPYKVARFNRDFTSGEVCLHRPYLASQPSVYPLEYPLDELLLTNLLARGRGVEVHACGVVDTAGRGYLFIGQSGAGKSTMARLWQKTGKAQILSDDRIILRDVDKRLWMYGTPWHGEAQFSYSARAPVTGLFFLCRGQRNELASLRGAEAAARLFACSFPPFYSREGLDFTLSFLEQVVKSVPCYELRFVPDESVVDFLLRGG